MEDKDKYGFLLTPSIKLHRNYFREMCKMLGIRVLYRSPLPNKHYTTYAEIDSSYNPPILVGCIFDDHPKQQTLKKLGWVSELQENSSLIHVDYDLPGLQQGCLFIVPSGLDGGRGRLFRVVKLVNDIVYPASVTCEIVPEYEDTIEQGAVTDFSSDTHTLVHEEQNNQIFDFNPQSIMSDE